MVAILSAGRCLQLAGYRTALPLDRRHGEKHLWALSARLFKAGQREFQRRGRRVTNTDRGGIYIQLRKHERRAWSPLESGKRSQPGYTTQLDPQEAQHIIQLE